MKHFPIILSAPSGAGKTTIARRLLEDRDDLGYSISCTTRSSRPGEQNGKDYFFLSKNQFVEERAGDGFAEWAEVHGNFYGTLRREVDRVLASGRHCLMDIDVQGAIQFSRAYPEAVLVFILPPSGDVLVDRLSGRGSEAPESLRVRLRNALSEISEVERYTYVVVNDDLELAISQVGSVIDAEALRRDRSSSLDQRISALVGQLERAINGI